MDKEAVIKEAIIKAFPKLADDSSFEISSPQDPNYNCIAWAYKLYKDRWMQPPKGMRYLDGVTWWPDGNKEGLDINSLVDAFYEIGYRQCDDYKHEEGYIKVALYYNPLDSKWTHAAREWIDGKYWISKLGQGNDIQHESPYTLEGNIYGKVYCIMKRSSK